MRRNVLFFLLEMKLGLDAEHDNLGWLVTELRWDEETTRWIILEPPGESVGSSSHG